MSHRLLYFSNARRTARFTMGVTGTSVPTTGRKVGSPVVSPTVSDCESGLCLTAKATGARDRRSSGALASDRKLRPATERVLPASPLTTTRRPKKTGHVTRALGRPAIGGEYQECKEMAWLAALG